MDQIAPDQETRGRPMGASAPGAPGLTRLLGIRGPHGQTGKRLDARLPPRARARDFKTKPHRIFSKPEPPLTARLIVRRTSVKSGRRHFYLYDIEFGDELIVIGSADHECDLARALLSRGVTGTAAIFDGTTGKHRTTVNIEKAALLTVRDTEREGPRFVLWKPLEPGDGPPGSGERVRS